MGRLFIFGGEYMSRQGKVRLYGAGGNGVTVPSWFGDASDGTLHVVNGEDRVLEVASQADQIVLHLDDLIIDEGGTLRPAGPCNGLVLLVRGDFILNGTINVDKLAPCENDQETVCQSLPQIQLLSLTGGAGGKGGNGYTQVSSSTSSLTANTRTSGGAGGVGFWCGGGNGGGGGASGFVSASTSSDGYYKISVVANGSAGTRAPIETGLPYTNPSTSATSAGAYGTGGNARQQDGLGFGGAAPGGSGATNHGHFGTTQYGYAAIQHDSSKNGIAGTGYGGGAVWIYVKGHVYIGPTAVISADGGKGADGVYSGYVYRSSGGGGGGGGGIIALIHNGSIEMHDGYSFHANGGNGGAWTPGPNGTAAEMSDSAANGSSGSATAPFISSLQDVFNNGVA